MNWQREPARGVCALCMLPVSGRIPGDRELPALFSEAGRQLCAGCKFIDAWRAKVNRHCAELRADGQRVKSLEALT